MSAFKVKTINHIIQVEGGYINDPTDSGGETNFGITKKTARSYGYIGPMVDLPEWQAFKIYEKLFWDKLRLSDIEELSEEVALELADTGVNQGVGRAAQFLQESLNVLNKGGTLYPDIKVDNSIGSKTIFSLSQYLIKRGVRGELVLFRMLNCLQGAFYVELAKRREKDEKYIFGWYLNRVV